MSNSTQDDDPIVRELLPGYLERRRQELTTLVDALERGDFLRLRTIGHNLYGSGGAYGLQKVSEFGAALEKAAQAEDTSAIRRTIQQIRSFLEELAT